MVDYKKYEPFFGSWFVTKQIGEGSFGQVFEIEKQGRIKVKPSALKIIQIPHSPEDARIRLAEGADSDLLAEYYDSVLRELVREIEIMDELKGITNIVSMEDFEVKPHEDGIGYDLLIKMELLKPIQYRMTEIGMKDVVNLGIDICKALEVCHENKIIHRDIKPSNIFISDRGDYKLGDFGIARTMSNADTVLSKKGTYNYMAPEIYMGNQNYDLTVDIYSLGVVMYTLLNNNLIPFASPDDYSVDGLQEALARRMRGEELPHLEIPAELDAIVRKACAHEPESRYASAEEMRRDLEVFRNNYFTEVIKEEEELKTESDAKPRPDIITAEETLYEPAHPEQPVTVDDSVHPEQPAGKEWKKTLPAKPPVKWIAIVCIAVVCAIGIFFGARALGGGGSGGGAILGGNSVKLDSVVVHTDIADNTYENAVILKVRNGKDNETLTNIKARDTAQGVEFEAYGCIPAGEEGLMAGVWYSDEQPSDGDSYEIIENTFDPNALQEYTQIGARLLDHGDNVTMETGHDAKGYAIDWNDDDFARYQIEISNENSVSFAKGETLGVAVVYDGDQLADGDIFYNDPDPIGAGSVTTDAAVLPKNLANHDGIELMILPKY